MAIIQAPPDALSRLPETLLNILVTKQKLEQEKERIGLAKKDFDLRAQQAQATQQRQQDMQAGAQAAAGVLLQQRPELSATVEGLSPGAISPFLENLQTFRGTAADIRGAEAGVRVAEATEAPAISIAESQARIAEVEAEVAPRRAEADLTNVQLRNQFQEQVLANDPQRGSLAISAWINSGGQLTWSEAKEAAGITTEDNINPDLRFKPVAQLSAEANRAKGFLPLMQETNNTINALNQQGVRLSLPSSLRQGSRSATIDALLNFVSDEKQQALVQANRAFSDFYRFSLSGQQSGESERLSMMLSITEQFKDADSTIAQKRRLRQVMIATQQQVVAGAMSPLEAAEAALDIARQLGDDNFTLAFELFRDGIIEEGPSNISGLGTTPGGVPSLIDRGLGISR